MLGGSIAPPSRELESLSDAESAILLPKIITKACQSGVNALFVRAFARSLPGEITESSICTNNEDGNQMS